MKKLLLIAVLLVSVFSVKIEAQSYRLVHAMLTNNNTDTTVVTIRDRMVRCNKAMCDEWVSGTIDSTNIIHWNNGVTVRKMEEWISRTYDGAGTEQRISDLLGASNQFRASGLSISDAALRNAWLARIYIVTSRIGEGSY